MLQFCVTSRGLTARQGKEPTVIAGTPTRGALATVIAGTVVTVVERNAASARAPD